MQNKDLKINVMDVSQTEIKYPAAISQVRGSIQGESRLGDSALGSEGCKNESQYCLSPSVTSRASPELKSPRESKRMTLGGNLTQALKGKLNFKKKTVKVATSMTIAGLVMNFLKGTGYKTTDAHGRSVKRKALTGEEFVKILKDDLDDHAAQLKTIGQLAEIELKRQDVARRMAVEGGRRDSPAQKKWANEQFEKFLFSLNLKRLDKVDYNKQEILDFFKPEGPADVCMIKLMKNLDWKPQVSIYEIKQPEQEQTLITKLEGKIVTTKHSQALMTRLVDSY